MTTKAEDLRAWRHRQLADEPRLPRLEDVGSGRVLSPFSWGPGTLKRGSILTGDQIRQMPRANLRALVAGHFLELFADEPPARAAEPVEEIDADAAAPVSADELPPPTRRKGRQQLQELQE